MKKTNKLVAMFIAVLMTAMMLPFTAFAAQVGDLKNSFGYPVDDIYSRPVSFEIKYAVDAMESTKNEIAIQESHGWPVPVYSDGYFVFSEKPISVGERSFPYSHWDDIVTTSYVFPVGTKVAIVYGASDGDAYPVIVSKAANSFPRFFGIGYEVTLTPELMEQSVDDYVIIASFKGPKIGGQISLEIDTTKQAQGYRSGDSDGLVGSGVPLVNDGLMVYTFYADFAYQDTLVIPHGVTVIGSHSLQAGGDGSPNPSTIILPNTVTTIMDGGFADQGPLESITIPASVTKIGKDAIPTWVIITGAKGSYAEQYAKENGYEFVVDTTMKPVQTAPNVNTASEWARDSINTAFNKGFVPTDLQSDYTNVITRSEFCRMAVKFVEYKTGKTIDNVLADNGVSRDTNAFTDTTDADILAAYALGITNGVGNNKFDPNGQFTREQAATMIMNVCKVLGMDVGSAPTSDFVDIGTASSWAVNGINFVRANGIMSGTGNDMFTPKTNYTRQESIVTFDRIK